MSQCIQGNSSRTAFFLDAPLLGSQTQLIGECGKWDAGQGGPLIQQDFFFFKP